MFNLILEGSVLKWKRFWKFLKQTLSRTKFGSKELLAYKNLLKKTYWFKIINFNNFSCIMYFNLCIISNILFNQLIIQSSLCQWQPFLSDYPSKPLWIPQFSSIWKVGPEVNAFYIYITDKFSVPHSASCCSESPQWHLPNKQIRMTAACLAKITINYHDCMLYVLGISPG